ncbi:NADP-dependent oxidoreductase [Streptomyces gamaensis]|uniref:NADP-dependent oxidoreductase n=1 Tax=Streptomyces gamaensis TaxID=1763542 RepID=A0ABW0YUP6_9ACTN
MSTAQPAVPRMKAVVMERHGGPGVLRYTDVARPVPGPCEVLVRVRAAGVNPVDVKTRAGEGVAALLGPPPYVLGWDVSGVVEETGFGVTGLRSGEEVYGMPRFPGPAGAYAQYVTAPSRHFARKPASLTHTRAAGLPLAGLTTWQTLVDLAELRAGQRVLVHAAGGGVGHLAVQLAKSRGAYVIGTCGPVKAGFVQSLGADETVDYTAVRFEDVVRDMDLVVDLVGDKEHQRRSLRTLRPGGLLVAVPSGVDEDVVREAEERGLRTAAVLVEPDRAGLDALTDLVESGRLRVEIDVALPLAEAAKAHELVETGRTRGKVVLTVD